MLKKYSQQTKRLPKLVSAAALLCAASLAHAAPAVEACAKPTWPADALRQEQTGTVTLKFKITRTGKVDQALIGTSSGFPLLDNAARDALSRCIFKPKGKPDKSGATWRNVQYIWTLEETSPAEFAAQLASARAGASRGDAEATYQLGMMYLYGKGIEHDKSQAVEWLQKAGKLGYLQALLQLGTIFSTGHFGPRDMPEAQRWLLYAAQKGSSAAQARLGRMLLKGDGLDASPDEGIKWLRTSAAAGSSEGQTYLAVELLARAGDDGDTTEAISLLKQAAGQDDRTAQTRLAYLYRFGRGVEQDPVKAAALFNTAALAGTRDAQLALAEMYEDGLGVPRDVIKAASLREDAERPTSQ